MQKWSKVKLFVDTVSSLEKLSRKTSAKKQAAKKEFQA